MTQLPIFTDSIWITGSGLRVKVRAAYQPLGTRGRRVFFGPCSFREVWALKSLREPSFRARFRPEKEN